MGMSPSGYYWQEHNDCDSRISDLEATVDELWRAVKGDNVVPLRAGGRPLKPFVAELSGFGGGWLAANGFPDTKVELERVLSAECGRRGWHYAERQIRELASGLIAGYRAAIAAD